MANTIESIRLRMMLLESVNSKVEIVTNFGLIRGEVTRIQFFDVPWDYVVLKESENSFVYIPFFSIDSLIIIREEGDL